MVRSALMVLAILAVAATAAAHGMLERSEPRDGSTLKQSPPQVRLLFSSAIEPAYSRVEVLDAEGRRVDLGDGTVDAANRSLLRVSLPALPPGRYRVAWRVLSVDTHVTEGTVTFRIAP
jgi:methionine-rich copper-binding protein CopC